MTSRELMGECFAMLAALTAEPEYMDQDIVIKSVNIVRKVRLLREGLFELSMEADFGVRSNYLKTLENLNLYSRINKSESTHEWVDEQLHEVMNLMCTFVGLPEIFTYSNSGEIGFSLFKFD